jgi:tetratricopeptide (TPR) repeat protein
MRNFIFFLFIFFTTIIASCRKDFLDIKPDKKLVVPSTLEDLQSLLDYFDVHNANMPGMGELSSDDYYILSSSWNALSTPYMKNGYIWIKEIWEGSKSIDWNNRYQQLFYVNYVLEGLNKIEKKDDPVYWNRLKGSALFYRAHAFYQLAQEFCSPYDKSTSNNGYGIPLRLTSDLNVSVGRATVKETYDRIINDLQDAISLLPESDVYKTRPVKAAAFALLSRAFLTIQDYEKSLKFADSTLKTEYKLINFNEISTSVSYPMIRYNNEVIFHSKMTQYSTLTSSRLIMDSTLYRSYSSNDLRKVAWFKTSGGNYTFKGSYDGSAQFFNGLAIDECYLTKAECLARLGKLGDAINILNEFLVTRYKTGTYVQLIATTQQETLATILQERRKELLFRGIRWTDLRRLNLEASTAKTLYRNLNGNIYELKPNSPNYTLPIADEVIQISGIPQNSRE